jgi:hypothetical protein
LSGLLSRLDSDTRDYLSGLLAALDQGTAGRGPDMRRMLVALGPTSRQLGDITRALAQRRTALAAFVHNLASVTRAASQDGQLASVVVAGDQTLHAVAQQDQPLREAIAKLPATLDATKTTLADITPFAGELGPTLTALQPAVRRLPTTLQALGRFSDVGTPVIQRQLLPLVAQANPLLPRVGAAVADLSQATPPLTGSAQSFNYFLNELAYVPGGSNQGFLFWLDWMLHNMNSALSTADANGSFIHATALVDCDGIQAVPALQKYFGIAHACPN